jgi:hypothetical protein
MSSDMREEKTESLRPNASAFFEEPDEAFCAFGIAMSRGVRKPDAEFLTPFPTKT